MAENLFKRTGGSDFPAHLKVMVSGPPKSGKTTLLGTVPGILVLDTEPNANNLESIAHLDVPYVTITNTQDLKQVAFMLRDETFRKQICAQLGVPEIKAVAIDTLDSLQKIMKTERMKEQRASQFLRDDWAWLKTEMEEIVQAFTSLPMHVFFIVHTKSKEMGKGDDAYTVVLPGLEGAIAESIAGMVGYSLLSFRKEEVTPSGALATKYYLRTEGDGTYEYLGTRTAGRLPTVIEPNMATIMKAVMDGRPKAQPQAAAPAPQIPAIHTAEQAPQADAPAQEEVAQTSIQPEPAPEPVVEPVSEPVAEQPVAEPTPEAAPEQPAAPAAKAPDDEPVNAAAMTHVKRVYDSVGIGFPEDKIKGLTMGEARQLVKYWQAVQQDFAEGKGGEPPVEMLAHLQAMQLVLDEEPEPEQAKEVEPKIDGTIEQVLAYAGNDLTKVQEAYDFESAKDAPRKGLINRLESLGAQTVKKETPVETPAQTEAQEPVTPADASVDAPTTEAVSEEDALQAVVEQGLGPVEVIEETINKDGKCAVCGNPIDDLDLAELGKKRFNKLLCVQDYLAEIRSKQQ